MATLELNSFRCEMDTSEPVSDSPYFVIFTARPGNTPTSDVVAVRNPQWDNTIDTGDTGEPDPANFPVASNVGLDTVVLVALMEEDKAPDVIADNVIHSIQQLMQEVLVRIDFNNLTPAQIAARLLPSFRLLLSVVQHNDDILSIRQLPIPTPIGNLPLLLPPLLLSGGGGSYRVQFSMA